MTKLITRLFIKDAENTGNPAVRTRYGVVSSTVGIVCNLFLAVLKFILGILSHSIAVTADAANNLSDSASSVVTLVGFKLSSKPADREHPFGHGRIEYICALVIAFLVLLVGFELGKTSVSRITSGASATFSPFVVFGLFLSVCVKLWMSVFNKTLGKKINSSAMEAVSADSLSDALATGVTLISIIAAKFTALPVDGYIGILVSLLVMWAGIGIVRDTLTPLLGTAPDPELVKNIHDEILSYDKILGIHDLIVHEYGPGRIFASLHAEVSSTENIMDSHGLIDLIESEVSKKLGIEILIHMDPLEVENEEVCRIRDDVYGALRKLDSSFSMHDFRIVPSGDFKNILFDVVIPIDYPAPDDTVSAMVITAVSALDTSFIVKPVIDRNGL
ncbi:MAG: cation transporter [Oscillospiraceae bacterium]|nr:cation transporter [Oscillospiraceae bacterium]MBQ6697679.1 cation transporter [Oscillospiraceae bacterium]